MKCCKPIIELNPNFEFSISDDIFISREENKNFISLSETDIDLLKEKIICEYKQIISDLERGHRPDLEFLLEEISAVELENELDNREFIIQYYLNNNKY